MIVITGSTGFLGSHTLPLLIKQNIGPIRCFVRKTSDIRLLETMSNIDISYGTFEDEDSFKKAIKGAKALINIASLGFGEGPGIVKACEEMGVERAIFISTTAIFTNLNASTKAIRKEAEKRIIDSNINYTILRPTMIYGTEKDRNMCRLVRTLDQFSVFPIFGTGDFLQQPIHVDDLAQAIVDCLQSSSTINKEYNVAGQKPLTYNEVIDQTGEALGKKILKVHLPLGISRKAAKLYEKISTKPIVKEEQILRLNENKNFNYKDAVKDFGFSCRTFKEGIEEEIARMRNLQII